MKILVTGSAGLVGRQIVNDLVQKKHIVYAAYNNSKPENGIPIKLDLSKLDSITQIIQEIKPDSIIHLAAMTGVDQCEINNDLALTVNAKATGILAQQAAQQNSFFLYVSTDYVFDGNQGMYKETDRPNPINFYGKSKLAGELELQKFTSNFCIARTSTPFGVHPLKKSFPVWVIDNLKHKKKISVLTDQYTSPTYVPNLCKMLIEIVTKKINGLIHIAGFSRISRFDVAKIVAKQMNLDSKLIEPSTTNKMKWNAKRPLDSSLDVSKASKILKEKPQLIEYTLTDFCSNLINYQLNND